MYSQFIAWLKILLPLGALALLSTIFLLSRSPDPIATIPVLANGVDPSKDEQVGSPFYAGMTDGGHALTVAARQARAGETDQDGVLADDIRAVLEGENEDRITIDATLGQMDNRDRLMLRQGVTVKSTTGYTVRTDGLNALIDKLQIDSTGPVDADGPRLVLSAGKFRIEESENATDLQMLFTDGVKLVYTPQNVEAD